MDIYADKKHYLSLSYCHKFKLVIIFNAYVNGNSPLKNFVAEVTKAGRVIIGSNGMVVKKLIGI